MSLVLPYTPADARRWAARDGTDEPVRFASTEALGYGFTLHAPSPTATATPTPSPTTASQPNLRTWRYERSVEIPELHGLERPGDRIEVQRIVLARWWDRPLSAGAPMQIASTRQLTTDDGHTLDVHTTSVFEGFSNVVDVVFVNGADWCARVTLSRMPREDVDRALRALRIIS